MAGELIGGFTASSPLQRGPFSSWARPDRRTIRIPATNAAPQARSGRQHCNAAIADALRHTEAILSAGPPAGFAADDRRLNTGFNRKALRIQRQKRAPQ